MRDEDLPDRPGEEETSHPDAAQSSLPLDDTGETPLPDNTEDEPFDESLTEEFAALIDDGRTYAEAELAFQKTRASLAGRKIGGAIAFGILALIFLHLALIALAVGLVIALEPLVTIWGAIAIVVGLLLVGVVVLVLKARNNAMGLAELFKTDET